jgi:mannose-6-phosphate isomerase-like protein (cupin superfamily)
MKHLNPTVEEMERKYVARFKDLVPTKAKTQAADGIPVEVIESMRAQNTFNVMSPGALPGQLTPTPVVRGGDAGVFRLGFGGSPPGHGPLLHQHTKTVETFVVLSGRWRIKWGAKGERFVDLDPHDLISIPPTVIRGLENISDSYANLLVIIQGQADEFDDVDRHPDTARMIETRFGVEMLQKLHGIGYTFRAGLDGEA